jgi:hypothetical protein
VYLARNQSIKVPVSLYTREQEAETNALLDSGATECFINPRLVDQYQVTTEPLKKTRKVRNVDGTTNRIGAIMHAAKLIVQHQSYATCHLFLVADIGEDNLILGYPFFEATNPTIDWVKGELTGEVTLSSEEDWEQLPEADKGTLFHARIAKTTVAQQLAEQATDKKERTWQEQVPEQYHRHGKVFSEQASERFPGER